MAWGRIALTAARSFNGGRREYFEMRKYTPADLASLNTLRDANAQGQPTEDTEQLKRLKRRLRKQDEDKVRGLTNAEPPAPTVLSLDNMVCEAIRSVLGGKRIKQG